MSVLWTDPLVSGIAAAVLAAVLGFVTIPVILSYAWRKMLLDKPDERKLHKTPTPRLAGLVFLPIIFLCVLAACLFTGTTSFGKEEVSLLAAAVLIYLVEYIDDLHTLSWKIKFLVQGLAAGAITFSGLWLRDLGGLLGIHALPAIAGIPLTIVLIVLITNALNLIDGLDGQAGGICFIAMVFLAAWNGASGQTVATFIAAATAGVLIPFLYHNILGTNEKRNKTFMGDTGSQVLGFILGFLVIRLAVHPTDEDIPVRLISGFSLVALASLDLVRLFFWRILHGRSPFQPDANHIHHKMMRSGFSPLATLGIVLMLDLTFILADRCLIHWDINVLLLLNIGFWMVVNGLVNLRLKRAAK